MRNVPRPMSRMPTVLVAVLACGVLPACFERNGFDLGDSDGDRPGDPGGAWLGTGDGTVTVLGDGRVCVQEADRQLCSAFGFVCADITLTDSCGVSRDVHCDACTFPDSCGGAGVPGQCGREAWFPLGSSAYTRWSEHAWWGSAHAGGMSDATDSILEHGISVDIGIPTQLLHPDQGNLRGQRSCRLSRRCLVG